MGLIMKYLECGKTQKKGKGNFRYTQSGLDNIILEGVPNYICLSCKSTEWEVPCSEGLHLMIAFALVFKPKALTGREARFLRKHLCYTGEELARIMGVKRMTVTRW